VTVSRRLIASRPLRRSARRAVALSGTLKRHPRGTDGRAQLAADLHLHRASPSGERATAGEGAREQARLGAAHHDRAAQGEAALRVGE